MRHKTLHAKGLSDVDSGAPAFFVALYTPQATDRPCHIPYTQKGTTLESLEVWTRADCKALLADEKPRAAMRISGWVQLPEAVTPSLKQL